MQKQYDAIVIGAGPSGTTIACLLANEGKKVLLVDKNTAPGGRMITLRKDGFAYELFPINCVPAHGSLFEKLSSILGKDDLNKVIYYDERKTSGRIYFDGDDGEIIEMSMAHGFNSPGTMAALGIKKPEEGRIIGELMQKLATMPPSEIDTLYNISAIDYVSQFGNIPESFKTFILATLAEGVFEMASDKVPAGDMVKQFQTVMKQGGGRYYAGGIGTFFENMASAVEENGGSLLMNTRVESVLVESGKVCGIKTKDGEVYHAPMVICSAGIRQTVLKLTGESHFEAEYLDKVKKLESNLACVGYRYFVDKPVLNAPSIVYFPKGCLEPYAEFERMARGEKKPEHNYIYIGTTSVLPGCAPEGKQLVFVCMSCMPDPDLDIQPYLDYVEKAAKKVVPELYDGCIYRKEIMSPAHVAAVGTESFMPGQGGESYGIANSLGQSGSDRPSCKTPLEGLYLVGNDAGGFGVGTHQALDSAFNLFDMLKN